VVRVKRATLPDGVVVFVDKRNTFIVDRMHVSQNDFRNESIHGHTREAAHQLQPRSG
jgi:hypothetical protein